MPAKRRIPKKRLAGRAEREAWTMFFLWGRDYLNDLEPLGFPDDRAAKTEAAEVWHRLGADFLADRDPDSEVPWALKAFGPPRGPR